MATAVKPGDLRNARNPKRMSCQELLEPNETPHLARIFFDANHIAELAQRGITRLLRRHAACNVVLGLHLDVVANVLVEIVEHALRGDSWFALLLSAWFSRPENSRDCSRQLVPLAGLDHQLPPALRRQPVKLRPPIVFRRTLLDRDPSPLDKPVQRGIERSLLHLQNIVGAELDCFRDGMAMRRPQQQRAQN